MLEKIAADSVLRFERVSRVVTRYRKTAHTEVKTNDPLTTYVQSMPAHTDKRLGTALSAPHKKEADGLKLLNVNHSIQDVGESCGER